jgi:phosphoribosylamine--glycine ligase
MKILVIGGGGREHALVWKLAQSPSVTKIWCAPGNAGIADEAECVAVDQKDVSAMASLAAKLEADLTVVGPEGPLVAGVTDEFARRGLTIFGPSKAAAQLEGSKIFAKEFLQRHNIPTARNLGVFTSATSATAAMGAMKFPLVIKADGLCAGKGVLVAANLEEASAFLDRLMSKREFGDGGSRVIVEETLAGEEISLIVITDGERVVPLAPARDHKRIFDGDQGPNTGGMGAFSTDELLSADVAARIQNEIVLPAIRGMSAEANKYRGFLYFGLMMTADGPKVLEFNCRMGDPETQAIVMRMDFDLAAALATCAVGQLSPGMIRWKRDPSVCVIVATPGYPDFPKTGQAISGLAEADATLGVKVFHGGTRKEGEIYYTTSGRALGVTAVGRGLGAALKTCYETVGKIRFEGAHYRKDIARRALKQGSAVSH